MNRSINALVLITWLFAFSGHADDIDNTHQAVSTTKAWFSQERWRDFDGEVVICPGEFLWNTDRCRVLADGWAGFLGSNLDTPAVPLAIQLERDHNQAVKVIESSIDAKNNDLNVVYQINFQQPPSVFIQRELTAQEVRRNELVIKTAKSAQYGFAILVVLAVSGITIMTMLPTQSTSSAHRPSPPLRVPAPPRPRPVPGQTKEKEKLRSLVCESCGGGLDPTHTCLFCKTAHSYR